MNPIIVRVLIMIAELVIKHLKKEYANMTPEQKEKMKNMKVEPPNVGSIAEP